MKKVKILPLLLLLIVLSLKGGDWYVASWSGASYLSPGSSGQLFADVKCDDGNCTNVNPKEFELRQDMGPYGCYGNGSYLVKSTCSLIDVDKHRQIRGSITLGINPQEPLHVKVYVGYCNVNDPYYAEPPWDVYTQADQIPDTDQRSDTDDPINAVHGTYHLTSIDINLPIRDGINLVRTYRSGERTILFEHPNPSYDHSEYAELLRPFGK
jgi:hypothetical protein